MQVSYPPSQGSVKPELVNILQGTCAVMRSTGAPFMVNIYPFITRVQNRNVVKLDYCLFNAPPADWVHDDGLTYVNIFVAMLDALHVALEKIGCGDPKSSLASAAGRAVAIRMRPSTTPEHSIRA